MESSEHTASEQAQGAEREEGRIPPAAADRTWSDAADHVRPDAANQARRVIEPSADDRIAADEGFMREALAMAREAEEHGEVPIGAVVVYDGAVIARGRNTREEARDPSGHAEFSAMLEASRQLGRWRLEGCTVYVTLEPCIMCAGLMHQARIDRCVYGAPDPKAGALGSLYRINADERLNHTFVVDAGVLEKECGSLLSGFFAQRRPRKGEGRHGPEAVATKPAADASHGVAYNE
jgi:tRNA(adenine34) deaminase